MHRCKTIIITGGTVSGIGKGITAASIGRILIDRGFTVSVVKADPYLNQDAGTMNPFQHGEVFVTDDGAETDLDLGHYERFMDVNLSKFSNFTSGSVYRTVMEHEREGDFLGKTIQIIPHVTDEIKHRIDQACKESITDFLLVEIGGTIGDIEALPFIEALRQYQSTAPTDTIFAHVVKMDYLYPSDEGKTKPIQHAVTTLRSYGIQPNILIVRCKRNITVEEKEKISLFTGVVSNRIVPAKDAKSLYDIPAQLEASGLAGAILSSFGLDTSTPSVPAWKDMYAHMAARKQKIRVGLVGKYVKNSDAYLSVIEAISHAGIFNEVFTEIVAIDSELPVEVETVSDLDAVIVPGGFGVRGIEGKIRAIQIARENKVPFLGICLGLQTAVIEIARHKAGLGKATSSEFDETSSTPVIAILPDQMHIKKKGGTMRLGQYEAVLSKDSLAESLYLTYRPEEVTDGTVLERHRHRYEVNPKYKEVLTKVGLIVSGVSPDGSLVEFIELAQTEHPYFIATQAHPEFRSRPHRPHPLFAGLIRAAIS